MRVSGNQGREARELSNGVTNPGFLAMKAPRPESSPRCAKARTRAGWAGDDRGCSAYTQSFSFINPLYANQASSVQQLYKNTQQETSLTGSNFRPKERSSAAAERPTICTCAVQAPARLGRPFAQAQISHDPPPAPPPHLDAEDSGNAGDGNCLFLLSRVCRCSFRLQLCEFELRGPETFGQDV